MTDGPAVQDAPAYAVRFVHARSANEQELARLCNEMAGQGYRLHHSVTHQSNCLYLFFEWWDLGR